MKINATIEKIQYEAILPETLQCFSIKNFDINNVPTACLVKIAKTTFAISRWVSPKRTRSYPYERVYNTLGNNKRITVIPIIKDEGQAGDRDYLQWDTVSLMSLLDVFVIFAYYNKADAAGNKITNQQFDNDYVITKIMEIKNCHSSALHWNLDELKNNFDNLLKKVKSSYTRIQTQTGVKLHNFAGIDNFRKKISRDVENFKQFSREKAEKAQAREAVTIQPKEALSTASKARITITNYLGGEYYFTVDEILEFEKTLHLIESKHSKNALLPSKSDIKDGLLKLILYSNLASLSVKHKRYYSTPILKLTSTKLIGFLNSTQKTKDIIAFAKANALNYAQITLIKTLFVEAQKNNFIIIIQQIL